MSSLISIPFRPVLNQQNGSFEAGARMTVYRQGTTTLESLFEDEALTTPIPNPLTADGYGVFPAVYWNQANNIRVIIEQSDGAVLFDLDPYISTVFDAEAILDQAQEQAIVSGEQAAAAAASAAAAAGSEAAAEALIGPTYASTAAGLAATTNGQYFAVVVGDVVEIYLNNAGVAVLQRSILSATATQAAIAGKANAVHTHVIGDVTNLQSSLDAKAPLASPALTGTATYQGLEIGFRKIPRKTTSGTTILSDNAGCVEITANITIPASVYEEGHALMIYNNTAGSLSILQGAGLTLRQAATANTGNRTIAQRGIATVWFRSPTEAIISGPGVT